MKRTFHPSSKKRNNKFGFRFRMKIFKKKLILNKRRRKKRFFL